MSTQPAHPVLAPHATVLRRGPGSVQVGLAADTGIVLSGLTDAEIALLARLDGTRDRAELARWAEQVELDPARMTDLLDQLTVHGLLEEAETDRDTDHDGMHPDVARSAIAEAQAARARYRMRAHSQAVVDERRRRSVLIDGHGNLAEVVAQTLRACGYGRVRFGPWAAADDDLRLRTKSPAAGQRALPAVRDRAGSSLPDLVILLGVGAVSPADAEVWRDRGVAHLPLVCTETRVEVGPLLTDGRPCLRCLDLHRAARDPAWPEVLAQLTAPMPDDPVPATVASAVAAMAAGATATLAQDYLDLSIVHPGLAFEAGPVPPYLVRRRWSTHPGCRCSASHVTMTA